MSTLFTKAWKITGMRLPEDLASSVLIENNHYRDFLVGKVLAEDLLAQDIADAIRLAYLEGIEIGKKGILAEID